MLKIGLNADNVNMEESEFFQQLQAGISQKTDWYNSEVMEKLLLQFRIVHSCVKNLYDMLTKRSLIEIDPYRLDQHISDIVLPEVTPFADSDIHSVIGKRFSDYETMLDYICTYVHFSVEALPIPKVKKLLDFIKVFDWEELVISSQNPNAHGLAVALNNARSGAPAVVQTMINDCVNECSKATGEIKRMLNELGIFQREIYKYEIRREVINKSGMDLSSGGEAEFNEIKKLFPKSFPKRPFYADLVNEIVGEDQGANKEKNQAAVLKRLEINTGANRAKKKKAEPNPKELLMATVLSVGALAPTIGQLNMKLTANFSVLFEKKKTFVSNIVTALKKAFRVKEKERIIEVPVKDAKTGSEKNQRVKVRDFLGDLVRKERIYAAIAAKGPEYQKVEASGDDTILAFLNKQVSDIQSAFTLINALDAYFKNAVDVTQRQKIKGMQIELSALRNSIISINKKRGDFLSLKEESEQMKKLGITENED